VVKAFGLGIGVERMKKTWLMLVVLSFVVVGCSSESRAGYADSAKSETATAGSSMAVDAKAPPVNSGPINLNRQVIRNGSMTVRVKNVEEIEKTLVKDLTKVGGYVASSESAGYGGKSPSSTIDLRVPSGRLDEFIDHVSAYGVVLNKQLSSEDVTDQLIDLGARMKTLRLQEEKYQGLVAKMTKISEIHELETRLGEIRTEIERISATQKSMLDRAALSTLKVTLTQDSLTTVAAASQGNWFGEAWGQSSGSLLSFAKGAGSVAVWLLVWSPVWGVLAGGVWLLRRQVRSKV
jgi:hypothetical protein